MTTRNTVRLTLKSRRRNQDGRWNRCWSSTRQTKPFDGARDRVKVDQKDLDEHRNNQPSWCQFRTGGGFRTDDERNRCADACVNSGITHADRTGAREQEIQEDPRILRGDVQCQRSD